MKQIKEEVFFHISADGKQLLSLSSNYEKIWGLSGDRLREKPDSWLEAIPLAQREKVAAAWRKLLTTRGQLQERYQIVKADLAPTWIVTRSFAIREAEKITGFMLISSVTDLEKERCELAMEVSGDGVWEWHVLSDRLFLSSRAQQIREYKAAEINPSSERWLQQIHPEDLPRFAAALKKHLQDRIPFKVEYRIRCKNGAYKWILNRGKTEKDDRNEINRIVGIESDINDRKQIEENLQKSEAKYRRIVENMTEGLAIVNENRKFVYVNQQLANLLGCTVAELLSKDPYDFVYPEDRAEIRKKGEARRRGVKECYDFKFRRQDGSDLWLMVSASPILDGNGKYCGSLVTVTDISKRKKIEEDLQKSEEKYRRIIETMTEGLVILDEGGKFSFVNPQLAEMSGYSSAELLGMESLDFVKESDRPAMLRHREIHRQGVKQQYDFKFCRRDGSEFWAMVSANPILDRDGKYTGTIATVYDISDRKSAEQQIAQTETFLHALIYHLPLCLFVKDSAGKYVTINRNCEQFFGLSEQEVIGKTDYELFPGEQADFINKKDREVFASRTKVDIPAESLDSPDLGRRIMRTIKVPLYDSAGQPKYLMGISEDITDRQQILSALQQSEAKLRLALQAGKIICWEKNLTSNTVNVFGHILDDWLKDSWQVSAAEQSWQISAEEILAKYFSPEERKLLFKIIARAVETEGEFAIEHRCHQVADKWYSLQGKVIGDRLVGIAIDITNRKLAEIRSKQAEQFLQMLIDYLPVALFVKDAKAATFAQLVLLNKNCEQLFNVTTKEAIGKTGKELFCPQQAEFFERGDREAFTAGRIDIPPMTIDTENLGKRILRAHKVPLYDSQNQPEYLLCIAEDITERYSTQAALRESEARLAGILDNAEEGIISIDSERQITMFNQGAEKLFGYKTSEIIGRPLEILLPDRYNPTHDRYISEFASAPEIARKMGERKAVFARRRDGSEFPAEISISKLQLAGSVIFTAIVRDITDRIAAEAALRRSEERFQLAVIGAGDGIWEWDAKGNCAYFSPKCKQILGYEDREIKNQAKYFFTYLHPDDRQMVKKALKNHWQKQVPFEVECRLRHKNGRYIWIYNSAQTIWNEAGKPIRMAGSIRDITVRKLVEKNLREHEQFLENIFDSATEVIWVVERYEDGDFYILTINKTVEKYSGIPPSEWIGKGLQDTYQDPEIVAKFRSNYETCLQKNTSISFEYYRTYKGQERCFLITVSPLKAEPNSPSSQPRVLAMAIDISDRKKAQEFLTELEKERELSQMQLGFFSMASHEFRTPLSTILVIVQSLISYGDRFPPEKIVKKLYQLEKVAKRMTEIIDNILKINRAETGNLAIDTKLLNPEKMCLSIVKEVKINAGGDREIIFIGHGVNSLVQIDPQLFHYILTNLLTNAVKYSPNNSKIHLILKSHSERIILIVKDKGIGIPQADLPLLFQPFYRAQNVEKRAGSGLGLTVVKKCVELHGGTIRVKSKYGKGTTFTVIIPTSK